MPLGGFRGEAVALEVEIRTLAKPGSCSPTELRLSLQNDFGNSSSFFSHVSLYACFTLYGFLDFRLEYAVEMFR